MQLRPWRFSLGGNLETSTGGGLYPVILQHNPPKGTLSKDVKPIFGKSGNMMRSKCTHLQRRDVAVSISDLQVT